ncbi:nephrin-like [Tropilaelaps mercedesae]|uniref:Nephrin-like n=1 Tax=Tropilaelaps mercedesae TaxID=418985 RepID=A0A1V9Y377_9ACAR|nr:nephrin-like [Tropilaelaps mercedesae]
MKNVSKSVYTCQISTDPTKGCMSVKSKQNTAHLLGIFSYLWCVLDCIAPPDPPMGLQAFNISHHAVRLSWQPGFDGGHLQTFHITYRKTSTDARSEHPVTVSSTADVDNELRTNPDTVANVQQHPVFVKQPVLIVNLTSSQSSLIVEDLEANTEYTFEVTSSNVLGRSRSPSGPLEVITQNIPQMDSTISMAGEGGLLSSSGLGSEVGFRQAASPTLYVLVAAVAGLLLCVNLCLLGVFLRRRGRNNDSQADGDCDGRSASGKKPSSDKKVFLVGERKSLSDKATAGKKAAGFTRDGDDHWIQTPPKLEFQIFRTPDHEPVAKQVALHHENIEQEVQVVAPQLGVAANYGPQSSFDPPLSLAQVPFPDVLPLPRTLLSSPSSTATQPLLSASGQLPSEVILPPSLSTEGTLRSHRQHPTSLPIRDVFDPALRRYSTTSSEAITALQRGDLVSSTLPRNLHLRQQIPQQRAHQQQQAQQHQQQTNQQMSTGSASSSRVYGGAATLGRPPKDRPTMTQRPGVRWNPAVQMIPPTATAVACPTNQGYKQAS